ncbi:hypothetical protein IU494_23275 [Nocardia terpenica]|uniref:hypothetical protein n=1 Tax=Nocardia terpenica TaxID=455432 RepID=UPI0018955355|nr:hypothetical protein [Nocardia terpenica]MBF6064005.1 hypothetical protein [Nocardia terpenica]MBF6114827.1 hypothetical protein [Nocardia terpenica]MBF6121186.1 hypothetical protein [Nocardia terpenica]MBF6153272.1 hypothetical protein [Nocardia terpenica]
MPDDAHAQRIGERAQHHLQADLPDPPGAAALVDTPAWRIWLAAWPVMAVFVLSNAATPLYPVWRARLGTSAGTLTLGAALAAGLLIALTLAALAAGIGQGAGAVGWAHAAVRPDARRAEAAALDVGGYIPAAVLPVTAGYLGDAIELAWGAGIFAVTLGRSHWWAACWRVGGIG